MKTQTPIIQQISKQNSANKDYWIKDGHDYILHLGSLKKAIIIAYYFDNKKLNNGVGYYSISTRSFFPFKDADFELKYEIPELCKEYACCKVKEWLESVYFMLNC